MLRSAKYIEENIIKEDGINTFKKGAPAQVGYDISVKDIYEIKTFSFGRIMKDKTYAPEYKLIEKCNIGDGKKGWILSSGTYILSINEGVQFGPNDTGLFIQRSSLNRSGCTIISSIWDPGYSSPNSNSTLRLNVDASKVVIEEDARVAQLIIFENEDTELYSGQWQGGLMKSKLVKETK